MRRIIRVGLIAALAITTSVISTSACSVCRCGDNVFAFSDQALSIANEADTRSFRLCLANSYSSKSNDLANDQGTGTEQQREFRPSAKAIYQLSDHFSVSAELPLSFRRLDITTPWGVQREKSSGIGDAELSGLWMTNLGSANGRHYSTGLSVSIKLPTGHNDARSYGMRVEEHLQSGTGTFDYTFGGAIARSTCASRIFASAYYRDNGTNDFDYHYGNALLANIGGQRFISSRVIGSIQLNARRARRDLDRGEIVYHTGGTVAYLTPGLRFALGPVASFSASVQIPVWEDLFGIQDEKAVLISGVSFSL